MSHKPRTADVVLVLVIALFPGPWSSSALAAKAVPPRVAVTGPLTQAYVGPGPQSVPVTAKSGDAFEITGVGWTSDDGQGRGSSCSVATPCGLTYSADLGPYDASRPPEGRHTVTVKAATEAMTSAPLTLSFAIDRSAPVVLANFDVSFDPGTAQAALTWGPSWDPDLPDGTPGSGVASYKIRYQRGASAWSGWQSTPYPYLVLNDTFAGEQLNVEAQPVDAVGNAGPLAQASLTVADTDADGQLCEPGDNCLGPPDQDLPDETPDPDNSDRYCATVAECSSHDDGSTGTQPQALTSSARPCEGWFAALNRVAHVFFWREASGRLYWDFRLTRIAWAAFGPEVGVTMTWAQVNNHPINPPYRLHIRPSTYNFHSSLLRYQKFGGGGGTIQTHDIVQFWWLVVSETPDNDTTGGRYIRCEVPAP